MIFKETILLQVFIYFCVQKKNEKKKTQSNNKIRPRVETTRREVLEEDTLNRKFLLNRWLFIKPQMAIQKIYRSHCVFVIQLESTKLNNPLRNSSCRPDNCIVSRLRMPCKHTLSLSLQLSLSFLCLHQTKKYLKC